MLFRSHGSDEQDRIEQRTFAVEEGFGAASDDVDASCPGSDTIEFGDLDDGFSGSCVAVAADGGAIDPGRAGRGDKPAANPGNGGRDQDPFHGPEVELVFDPSADPFEELFAEHLERVVMQGPDDFSRRRHVASREGATMAKQLGPFERKSVPHRPETAADPFVDAALPADVEPDDSDMVVIEEDILDQPSSGRTAIVAVRPGDYRSLFARLRRGDR